MRHSYKKKFDYERFGFKDPLYQIDNQFKITDISPLGMYELTFVSPEKLYSVITYVDKGNVNFHRWQHICEDENNYYVISDLIEKTNRKKIVPPSPNKISTGMIDRLADADYPLGKTPTVECVEPRDSMRKFVMEAIQETFKLQDKKEQEQEAKSKPEGYDPGLFYEVEKGN